MSMNIASFAYIPPPHLPFAEAFVENVTHFRNVHPLHLLTEHPWGHGFQEHLGPMEWHPISNPEWAKWAREEHGPLKHYAISNAVFLTALRLAVRANVTHMLYLEADCRVGKEKWDLEITNCFQSAFGEGFSPLIGGSVVVRNPCNSGREAKCRFDVSMKRWLRGLHASEPGSGPHVLGDGGKPCVYTNGCGSVIDVAWAASEFNMDDTVLQAMTMGPWDLVLGQKLWDKFGPTAYEKVAHLPSMFSSYGDMVSTEAERLQMLRDGKVVLVHQVKSNARLQ